MAEIGQNIEQQMQNVEQGVRVEYLDPLMAYAQAHPMNLIVGGAAFCLWAGFCWLLLRKAMGRLRVAAQKTPGRAAEALLSSAGWPLVFFVVASGLGLIRVMLDLPPVWETILFRIIQALMVLAFTLFASRMLDNLMRLYGHAKEIHAWAQGYARRLWKALIWLTGAWALLRVFGFSPAQVLSMPVATMQAVKAAAFFGLWTAAFLTVKRRVFFKFRKRAQSADAHWNDMLIASLNFPVTVMIVVAGLAIAKTMLVLEPRVNTLADVVLKGAVVTAAMLLGLRLFDNVLQYGARWKHISVLSSPITRGLSKGIILGTALLILLDMMGISITPLLASIGFLSLAVALAAQDTFSNFFAGIHIMVDRPLKVGDFVRLEGGQEGTVREIGWRSTRLRTPANQLIVLPNNKLTSSMVVNYFMPAKTTAVSVEVGIEYQSDLAHVEEVTRDVGRNIMQTVPGGVPDSEPIVRYHGFGDFSINFTVTLQAKEFGDQGLIKHEFIKALHQRFARENIVMPSRAHEILLSQVLGVAQKPDLKKAG